MSDESELRSPWRCGNRNHQLGRDDPLPGACCGRVLTPVSAERVFPRFGEEPERQSVLRAYVCERCGAVTRTEERVNMMVAPGDPCPDWLLRAAEALQRALLQRAATPRPEGKSTR